MRTDRPEWQTSDGTGWTEETDEFTLHHGDCLDVLRTMEDESVHSIVTDPPYELGYAGQKWDSTGIAFNPELWQECLRVIKPGGYLLAFGGTRTWHRLAVAIEDAGWILRSQIAWLYRTGMPNGRNLAKSVEAHTRGYPTSPSGIRQFDKDADYQIVYGEEAQEWDGWNTTLKPAFEPIILAQKKGRGTIVENLLEHRTGGMNIDALRIPTDGQLCRTITTLNSAVAIWKLGGLSTLRELEAAAEEGRNTPLNGEPASVVLQRLHEYVARRPVEGTPDGRRWPMNVLSDGSCGLDDDFWVGFFEARKPSSEERPKINGLQHHTTKPLRLIRWLVTLVTPPGGRVLDPFEGSGTHIEACMLDGFYPIGVEKHGPYIPLIEQRIERAREAIATGDIPPIVDDQRKAAKAKKKTEAEPPAEEEPALFTTPPR